MAQCQASCGGGGGGWRWGGGRGDDRAWGSGGVEPESEGVEQNKVPAMHLLGQVKSSN